MYKPKNTHMRKYESHHKVTFKFSIIVIAIVSLLMTVDKCQAQCKLSIDKTDDFTNERIKQTKLKMLAMPGMGLSKNVQVCARKVNEHALLGLVFNLPSVTTLREGEGVIFKLSNNEVVTIANNQTVITDYTGVDTGPKWRAEQMLHLNEEQFELLKQFPIIKLRVQTSDGDIDFEVKEGYSRVIMDALVCIQQ